MSEEIKHNRRHFLGTAAMTLAAAQLGAFRSANAESKNAELADVSDGPPDSLRFFHINVPEAALIDLRQRIAATRWPEKETVTDPSQGVQLATIQKVEIGRAHV